MPNIGASVDVALVKEMRGNSNEMDRSAYIALLQMGTKNRSLPEAKQIHMQMKNAEVENDIFLSNLLISMYVKCRSLSDAHRIFSRMTRRDLISWNSMISGCAQQGLKKKAFQLFEEMQEQGFIPNKITYISMLTSCSSPAALQDGKFLHSRIINAGFHRDPRVENSLLSMYGRCEDFVAARNLFNGMAPPDVVSYNAMLGMYARQGNVKECVSLYEQMLKEGISPDKVTYINVLDAFHSLQEGKRIHALIVKAGLQSDVRVGTALVGMFIRCGDVVSAKQAFEEISGRDVVAWNAMIAALAQHGQHNEALAEYHRMRSEGVVPNKVTYISILNACSTSKALSSGEVIYDHISEAGLLSDVRIGNALVSMLARCGNLRRAREFFDNMPKKDLISWNAIIAAYARGEDRDEAMKLYKQMQSAGVKPGRVTFLHLLSACGSPAALTEGQAIHQDILANGVQSNVQIGNALMSMYRKCGSVSEAQKVFDDMPARDVISWNSIIAAHGQHGSSETAFNLFQEMRNRGYQPDAITFTSILSACRNSELGKEVHKLITGSGFKLDARLGNALINMYIRCGSLEDAREVFDNLPSRDVLSWTAIIGGCAEHGDNTNAFELFWRMQTEV